jgi:hypothetical protein
MHPQTEDNLVVIFRHKDDTTVMRDISADRTEPSVSDAFKIHSATIRGRVFVVTLFLDMATGMWEHDRNLQSYERLYELIVGSRPVMAADTVAAATARLAAIQSAGSYASSL